MKITKVSHFLPFKFFEANHEHKVKQNRMNESYLQKSSKIIELFTLQSKISLKIFSEKSELLLLRIK